MRRPHWRKMTWVLIIWCAVILIWAIAGGASGHNSGNCAHDTVLGAKTCQDAVDAGTTIGVALILLIGFFGFVFFGLIWLMTRPKGRDCPACGELVKRGRTQCPSCGYDFAAAASQRSAVLPAGGPGGG